MPTTPLKVNQTFPSFEDLKSNIQDWAICDKFEFRMVLKDAHRADYRCKTFRRGDATGCSWRVFASRIQNSDIEMSKIINEYTCLGTALSAQATYNTQTWL